MIFILKQFLRFFVLCLLFLGAFLLLFSLLLLLFIVIIYYYYEKLRVLSKLHISKYSIPLQRKKKQALTPAEKSIIIERRANDKKRKWLNSMQPLVFIHSFPFFFFSLSLPPLLSLTLSSPFLPSLSLPPSLFLDLQKWGIQLLDSQTVFITLSKKFMIETENI